MYSRARAFAGVPTGRLPIVPASTVTWVDALVSLKTAGCREQADTNDVARTIGTAARLIRTCQWYAQPCPLYPLGYHEGSFPYPTVADLFYGDGAGRFTYAGHFGSMGFVFEAKAADVNRDGRSDLVIATANFNAPAGGIEVLLAGGAGFVPQPRLDVPSQPRGIDVADIDRNGTPDLAVVYGYNGNGIQLFSGDGAGGFSAGQFLAGYDRTAVRIADINRDALPDIVSGGGGPLIVWLAATAGSFGSPREYGDYTYRFVLADLTGDGNLDVMTATSALLRGAANGTFAAPIPVNISR
jgi:FG-GAP-like repeat